MGCLRSFRGALFAVGATGLAVLVGACRGSAASSVERVEKAARAAPARLLALALGFPVEPAPPASKARAPEFASAALADADGSAASGAGSAAEGFDASGARPAGGAAAPTAGARGRCPDAGMVQIGAHCIDRYEAHLVTRGPDGLEQPWPHHRRPEEGVRYESRSEAGAYPQGYISRTGAAAACANAGKRLCSLGEWRRACQGEHGAPYPYGATARPGACNSGKPHLLTKWHGSDVNAWTFEAFNSPGLNLEPGFLAKGGEYEACRSENGVYDLVGNLHEWVSDLVTPALVTRPPDESGAYPPMAVRPGNGIFVGGFFSTTNENGAGCAYTTLVHEPAYHDYSTGFRCCADTADAPAGEAADAGAGRAGDVDATRSAARTSD